MNEHFDNDLLEIGHMLNKAFGWPTCYAKCEHGGACGLDTGHEGPHDSDGHCRWETPTVIEDRIL